MAALNSANEWMVPGLLRSTSTINFRCPSAQLLAKNSTACRDVSSVSISPGRPQSGAGAKSCAQYSAQPSLKAKPRPVWLQVSWVWRVVVGDHVAEEVPRSPSRPGADHMPVLVPGDRAVAAAVVADREATRPPDRREGREGDSGRDGIGVDLDTMRRQFGTDFVQKCVIGGVHAGPDQRALRRMSGVDEFDAAVVADRLVVMRLGRVHRPVVDSHEVLQMDVDGRRAAPSRTK